MPSHYNRPPQGGNIFWMHSKTPSFIISSGCHADSDCTPQKILRTFPRASLSTEKIPTPALLPNTILRSSSTLLLHPRVARRLLLSRLLLLPGPAWTPRPWLSSLTKACRASLTNIRPLQPDLPVNLAPRPLLPAWLLPLPRTRCSPLFQLLVLVSTKL